MRLTRPRFTVRTMLVWVAIVGAIFGLCLHLVPLLERRSLYLSRAAFEQGMADHCLKRAEDSLRRAALWRAEHAQGLRPAFGPTRSMAELADDAERQIPLLRREADFHSRRAERIRHAARRPWRVIDLDPPPSG